MKRAFIISGILLIVIAIIGFITVSVLKRSAPEPDVPAVQFPSSTNTTDNNSVSTVSDFLQRDDVHEDPYNAGSFYIGSVPSTDGNDSSLPFVIIYISQTNYFNIGITSEPLGEHRIAAETYLMNATGLSKDQLCMLNYSVSVANRVNSQYSGTNLGFSFCPNAVKLPQ